MGIVSEYVRNLIAKQVDDNGLVVLYDPDGAYSELDKDLAELYGVETRTLKQAVRRNIKRFPEDFMFELSYQEVRNLTSLSVISSWGGVRRPPMAFSEQGVAMLSSVLKGNDRDT